MTVGNLYCGVGASVIDEERGLCFCPWFKIPRVEPTARWEAAAFTIDKCRNAECSFRCGLPQFPGNVAVRAASVVLSLATEHVAALPRNTEANCEHTDYKKEMNLILFPLIKINPKPDLTLFLKEFSKRKQRKWGG